MPQPQASATVLSRLHGLANPHAFLHLARAATPIALLSACGFLVLGLVGALIFSPIDYQQKDAARILHVHVPAAWMGLFAYVSMAVASGIGMIFRHPLADVAAKSMAPSGAVFTALALLTGMLWGIPSWGTWWSWDARLTSMLILFFLYLGYMALWEAIEEPGRAAKAAAILAMVGAINIPIIHFSVDWWNTLHQKSSVLRADGPTIHASMLWPLLAMTIGYMALFAALTLIRMRTEIAQRRLRARALALMAQDGQL